jgi:hypothetical protein
VAHISARIDDDLRDRLNRRARRAGVSLTELLRPAIEDVAYGRNGYVFSSQDEILSVALQTLSILAAFVRSQSPEVLERGLADARAMLDARGLSGLGTGLEAGKCFRDAAEARTSCPPGEGVPHVFGAPFRGRAGR